MATLEDALLTRLTGFAELEALVGARAFHPSAPLAPIVPYVVFRRVTTQRTPLLAGASGYARPRVQFDAWAETDDVIGDVAAALRHGLDGFAGTVAQVDILSAALVNESHDLDREANLFHVRQDYELLYRED
jgi:hypothetical protein